MQYEENSIHTIAAFLGVFFLVFFLTASFLYIVDFVPEEQKENQEISSVNTAVSEYGEVPLTIRIPRIGVDTVINNPTDTALDVLDDALLSGAVRYPESALLGEDRPVFLFGHQSYLPVVHNKAFKAFNDLQKLEDGDIISVYSQDAEHQYVVRSVTKVQAEDALIPLTEGEQTLILSTCNSFGDPGDRYVVKADFVRKVAI